MKKKYIVVILIIALLINTFIVIYSKAANSVNWYERYDYDSEEIQSLIKQKDTIQSETNVAPQKDGFDLIIFMGQSNMVGHGYKDYAKQCNYSPVEIIDGAGYEMTFNDSNKATGIIKLRENEALFGSRVANDTTGSLVTAFMNAYYNNTGTPVIGIQAAQTGTSIYDDWQEGQGVLETAKTRFKTAEEYLNTNGYKIKHRYMVWYQGEQDVKKVEYTDNGVTKKYEDYLRNTVEAMQGAIKNNGKYEQDIGVERCFLIRIGELYVPTGTTMENKYKEQYFNYVNMVNKQTEICNDNNWVTLVSTSANTLSHSWKMMMKYKKNEETDKYEVDQVHLNQEALDIVGSEAGKNVAYYVQQSNSKTLTTEQENALINYAKNFSYWGTKNNAIIYGTLVKNDAYNLRFIPYIEQKDSDGNYTRKIEYDPQSHDLTWRNMETQQGTFLGSYGFNGETEFAQGYYIGFDCSGFASFLYHQVLGVKFDYKKGNTSYNPWTIDQYLQCLEDRKVKDDDGNLLQVPTIKLKNASGEKEIDVFKVVYQKVYRNPTIRFTDILNEANLQKGDLIIGYRDTNENHIMMYSGKDESGNDKVIHSARNPISCDMYVNVDGKKKYTSIGESNVPSSTPYKEIYVLRLNDDIVPKDYTTNDIYKTYSSEPYIDWDIIKSEDNIKKIDKVAPQGQVKYVKKKGETEVRITTTEDIMQVDGWKLSDDKRLLTKKFTQNAEETVTLEDLSANTTDLNVKVEIDSSDLTAQINYSITELTDQDVLVTIKASRQLQEVSGWTLSQDKMSLTEIYTENKTENVTIKDIGGDTVMVTVKVENINKIEPDPSPEPKPDPTPIFELKQYQIKNNYIVKIKPKTKYRDFIKDIETNQKYAIKEKDKEISGEDLIKTGQTLTTEDGHTYTLVVIGDLSDDGKIGIVELARISKIGSGRITDIKEIEKMAIDVNADGKINIIDLAAISKYAAE